MCVLNIERVITTGYRQQLTFQHGKSGELKPVNSREMAPSTSWYVLCFIIHQIHEFLEAAVKCAPAGTAVFAHLSWHIVCAGIVNSF